jgi:hypothetical protein
MLEHIGKLLLWVLLLTGCAGVVTCVLHVLGALIFAESSTAWDYLRPLSVLALFGVSFLERSALQYTAAYFLTTIFVLGYVEDGWRTFIARYDAVGPFLFPDALECLTLVILLGFIHFRRS